MTRFSKKFIGFYLFAFTIALPIPLIYSAIALVIMLINGVLLVDNVKRKYPIWIYLFIGYYLIDVLRGIVFENFSLSGFDDTKLSFLLIPVLFYNLKKLKSQRDEILICFSAGVVFYVLYAIGYMIYFYNTYLNYTFSFTDHYIVYMLYNYLPGAYHHTYIGIYMVFTVIFLINFWSRLKSRLKKIIIPFLLLLVFSFQIYIGSKMTMIISVIAVGYYFTHLIKSKKILTTTYVALISFTGFLGYLIKDWLLISINSIWYRIEYLKETVRLIRDNFWFGIGSNNIKQNELLIQGEVKSLIPHNLYLHDFLSNGILGFILILAIFFIFFKIALIYRSKLFTTYIIMCFLLGLTEDFLHLQRGVFFFVFFTSLFVVSIPLGYAKNN